MGKDRKDIAECCMLDRGDIFSFRKGDVTRIGSTRRGSTRYRAQPNNRSIMRIRGKELHCYSMYPFGSAKTAPV